MVPRAFQDQSFHKNIFLNECVERCLCLANVHSAYAWETQASGFAYTSIYLKFRKEYVYHICSWSFPWNSHLSKIQTFFVTFLALIPHDFIDSPPQMVVAKIFDGFVGSFALEEDDSWLVIIFWMGGTKHLSWERNFWIFQVFFSGQVEVFIIYTPLNISKRIPQMKCSVILGIYVMLNFGRVLNLIWFTWICCQYDKKRKRHETHIPLRLWFHGDYESNGRRCRKWRISSSQTLNLWYIRFTYICHEN